MQINEDTLPETEPKTDTTDRTVRPEDYKPTSDEIFDQLEDESRVVSSGRQTIFPTPDTSGGDSVTGFDVGDGSGSGTDD